MSHLRDLLLRIQFGCYLDVLLKRLQLLFFSKEIPTHIGINFFLLPTAIHNSEFSPPGGLQRELNGYITFKLSQSSVLAAVSMQRRHNY